VQDVDVRDKRGRDEPKSDDIVEDAARRMSVSFSKEDLTYRVPRGWDRQMHKKTGGPGRVIEIVTGKCGVARSALRDWCNLSTKRNPATQTDP
jgi:hypothetical protein